MQRKPQFFSKDKSTNGLLQKIKLQQEKLRQFVEKNSSLTDPEVYQLSCELDELLILYLKQKGFKGPKCPLGNTPPP